jgi:hypothetical protein
VALCEARFVDWARRLLFVTGLVAAGTLAAACGSGSASPDVASLGSTTTAPAPAAQGTGLSQKVFAFSQCMRSHGVANFPMPVASTGGHVSISLSPAIASSPQFQSAQAHCRSLLPSGGKGPTITPADQADYLKGVACMRSHGFPDFPDPTISNNQVHFVVPPGIDQNSSQFKQAVQTCERLIPAGLPYSDNGGT